MIGLKNLVLPAMVLGAGVVGVTGASLVSGMTANAATSATGNAVTASDSSSSNGGTSSGGSGASNTTPSTGQPDGNGGGGGPHNANGITETELTGDDKSKAVAAAEAAEPGATVVRAETDADGAKYEVHMKKSDGSMTTVKLDADFKVTSTEDGMR